PALAQSDSAWTATERAAREAFAGGDTLGFRNELLLLCDQLNGNPRVVLRLARVEAALGHSGSACQWLARYADMGLGLELGSDSLLASATADSSCSRTRERIANNLADPVDQARPVFTLPDTGAIAEDVAYDSRSHRYFVSSVRAGRVWCFDRRGRALRFAGPEQDSLWSVMALYADAAHGRLWVTSACLREGARFSSRDSGRTAVLCYELGSGKRLGRWEPPGDGRARAFGDMTVGPDGTAYVSESVQGAIYLIHSPSDSLETLLPEGTLRAPQTPALTPDHTRLMVADYALGIAVVELSSRRVSWLDHRRDAALTGVDGLYFSGRSLIAIQNGTQPERLIKIELNEAMTRVENLEVLQQNIRTLGDPTHGVLVGSDFDFIANSGWDRVNESDPRAPMSPGSPPQIMRIHLSEGP
ncbi:MAG: SMP-30/gluconolactonase/LRE family protein, partial [Candidatus Eiseniibacteriota bacterium]